MSITLVVEHYFSAAHRLFGYNGNCANLHGHNYRLKLGIRSDSLDQLGFSIDFRSVKQHILEKIDALIDHSCILNENDPMAMIFTKIEDGPIKLRLLPNNPTVENITEYLIPVIMKLIEKFIEDQKINYQVLSLQFVEIEESPGKSVRIDLFPNFLSRNLIDFGTVTGRFPNDKE